MFGTPWKKLEEAGAGAGAGAGLLPARLDDLQLWDQLQDSCLTTRRGFRDKQSCWCFSRAAEGGKVEESSNRDKTQLFSVKICFCLNRVQVMFCSSRAAVLSRTRKEMYVLRT